MKKQWKFFWDHLLIPVALFNAFLSWWIILDNNLLIAPDYPVEVARQASNLNRNSFEYTAEQSASVNTQSRAGDKNPLTPAESDDAHSKAGSVGKNVQISRRNSRSDDTKSSSGALIASVQNDVRERRSDLQRKNKRDVSALESINSTGLSQAPQMASSANKSSRSDNYSSPPQNSQTGGSLEDINQDYPANTGEESNVSQTFADDDDFRQNTPADLEIEKILAREERLQKEIARLTKRIENGESDRYYNIWIQRKDASFIVHDSQQLEQYEKELGELTAQKMNFDQTTNMSSIPKHMYLA
nr:hypothetical protein [Desulfobulbaceae bacterium]